MSWTSLSAASLGDDVILTSTTMQALYDNPTAIAQRLTGAPVVQVPVFDVKTSGTAATWTWPDGVTAVEITIVGGGGGGGDNGNATSGGDSSITYNSVTVTGSGGKRGMNVGSAGYGGAATNGTINVPGHYGTSGLGGMSGLAFGAGGGIGAAGTGYGGGGGADAGGSGCGGGGGTCIYRVAKETGLNTITYTVGAAGAGNTGSGVNGQNGSAGVIIFKY